MTSRIYVVTPIKNSAATLHRTIMSVLTQNGDFKVHYHLQDCCSTDGSDAIAKYIVSQNSLSIPIACQGITISTISEPDRGVYDGIRKGLQYMKPDPLDWVCWINADDFLCQGAFATLAAIDQSLGTNLRAVSWIAGRRCILYYDGTPVYTPQIYFNSRLIRLGICDGRHYHFIQQEGVFFRAWLLDQIDNDERFGKFRYAGDWYLWQQFAKFTELYQLDHPLGIFSRTKNQLSENLTKYREEIDEVIPENVRLMALRSFPLEKAMSRLLKFSYSSRELSQVHIDFSRTVSTFKEVLI
jgi:glycosyltransferase involved in cell wall biosynthesis